MLSIFMPLINSVLNLSDGFVEVLLFVSIGDLRLRIKQEGICHEPDALSDGYWRSRDDHDLDFSIIACSHESVQRECHKETRSDRKAQILHDRPSKGSQKGPGARHMTGLDTGYSHTLGAAIHTFWTSMCKAMSGASFSTTESGKLFIIGHNCGNCASSVEDLQAASIASW